MSSSGVRTRADGGIAAPGTADAASVVVVFVLLVFVVPAQLVLNYLPMSMSAATLVALGLSAFWLCAQLTTTLGAAKGFSPVRSALFAYTAVLLASYANANLGYLPSDERSISDGFMIKVLALVMVGLVVCDGVRTRRRLYFLLHAIVLCGAVVAIVGILQFLVGFDPTQIRPPGMRWSSMWDQTRRSSTAA